MLNYKDKQGKLHSLSYADIANGGESLLPEGSEKISDAEAEAIQSPAPTLAQAQAAQMLMMNAACQEELDSIVAPYPANEVVTWDQQLSEAVAYTGNASAPTPLLSAIIAESGATLATLSAQIIAASNQYKAISGAAIGKRYARRVLINAATTVAEVQAVVW